MATSADGPPGRETLLAHAASCPSCQSELAAAASLKDLPPPLPAGFEERLRAAPRPVAGPARRRLPYYAAAAAALLAAAPLIIPWRSAPAPRDAEPAAASARRPAGTVLGLGRCATAVLEPGARAEREGIRLLLHSGAAAITARGELVVIEAPPWRFEARDADFVAAVGKPVQAGWLLREAAAGAEAVGVRVLRGSVRALRAGESRELAAGDALGSEPSWEAGWQKAPLPASPLRDAACDLAPPDLPEAYAWEAVVVRRTPSSAMEIRFGAGGKGWTLPLGAGLSAAPGLPLRLGIERRDGWIRLETGGREILNAPAASLETLLEAGEARSPGIRAWGGDVEVIEARWRALP